MQHPHALITGGSSGIGLALAKQLAEQGYNISIVARDQQKLDAAVQEIQQSRELSTQQVIALSADVGNQQQAEAAVNKAIEQLGAPAQLITSAGIAVPGYFQELPIENFEKTMQINYFGTVYVIKAAQAAMQAAKKGRIVIVSSGAALTGIFGYTSYGASKFALRGFAEALRAEMKPLGLGVSIVYPPDTDTPQLHEENKTKPYETKQITGAAKLMTADAVASCIIKGVKANKFAISPNLEIKLLTWLNSIIAPLLYRYFDGIIKKASKSLQEEAQKATTK